MQPLPTFPALPCFCPGGIYMSEKSEYTSWFQEHNDCYVIQRFILAIRLIWEVASWEHGSWTGNSTGKDTNYVLFLQNVLKLGVLVSWVIFPPVFMLWNTYDLYYSLLKVFLRVKDSSMQLCSIYRINIAPGRYFKNTHYLNLYTFCSEVNLPVLFLSVHA